MQKKTIYEELVGIRRRLIGAPSSLPHVWVRRRHHPALRFLVAFFAGVFSDLAAAVIFSPDFRLAQRVHQVSGNHSDDFAINSFG
jgi:hypothetical protein